MTIKTDLELLKKEVQDMKQIHTRLDTAIEKLTDVSSCVNRILAVHEEKIARQEAVSYTHLTLPTSDLV